MFAVIAFLGGMVSLLSPCTLPVIPLLFASFRGSKRHILLLLLGMVVMFTALSLLLTVSSAWITPATRIGRWLALAMLAVAALGLISPTIAQRLAAPAVWLGNYLNLRSMRGGGDIAALLSGLAVELLWSPCAGPILGAILGTALAGGSPLATGVLLLAYGGGCALMLALLGVSGQRLVARLRGHQPLLGMVRRGGGGVMLIAVLVSTGGGNHLYPQLSGLAERLEKQLIDWRDAPGGRVRLQPVAAAQPTSAMPELDGGGDWINSPPLTAAALKGHVVLVDFWTYDCINCQHTLPHVRELYRKYQPRGLVVIGVHTPEYPWEKNLPSVQDAVRKWGIRYPVVTDNQYRIWQAFGNRYWPAQYYFDSRGQLRYAAFGEGNYEKQEQVVQQLLKEAHA
ncbi:redoxin domain-containing protein [Shimwellia pseudoproteus]|uniref:cytochrome c biogenesis protein/redoxin n=1 Tax=Shimwellia pseudoproteus TaxID=570012 RepID=UPI0018ECA232|nr:cytochrome c biogenesis protein/redoxin [Shimwellia pseudoproteus]MBJ3814963.1 redoxin domain-containing protein [Shimwellia pseudoproteus]